MSKIIIILSCFVLLAKCQAASKQNQKPKTIKEIIGEKDEDLPKTLKEALKRMEAIDVDQVLANDRILTNYLKCFLNKGPCTSEAKNFKKFIGLLVQTRCNECDPKQRKIIKSAMLQVRNRKPKEYQELVKLYDPKGTEIKELEKFLVNSRK